MAEIDSWVEAQEFQITLDAQGKIIDYLDDEVRRPNTPEERIRQKMTQILHCEFGYPKENIGLERGINIGREVKRADIVVYNNSAASAAQRFFLSVCAPRSCRAHTLQKQALQSG